MYAPLLNKITDYCLSAISLDDLRFWIAENFEVLFDAPDSEESQLVAEIEDIIVEAAELGEAEWYIRNKILSRLPKPISVGSYRSSYTTISSSSNDSIVTGLNDFVTLPLVESVPC